MATEAFTRQALLDILARQDDDTLVVIVDNLLTREAADGTDRLEADLGPGPTARDVGGAAATSIRLSREARETVLAKSFSRGEAAAILGVTAQAVSDDLRAGGLVGLREAREWRLPAWQLDPDLPDGRLPGIFELGATYPGGPVSLSLWVEQSVPDLGGLCPREAIRRGRLEEVLALLRAAGW